MPALPVEHGKEPAGLFGEIHETTAKLMFVLFILFGLFFGIQSLGLDLGTAFRMGPGYFPLVLAFCSADSSVAATSSGVPAGATITA